MLVDLALNGVQLQVLKGHQKDHWKMRMTHYTFMQQHKYRMSMSQVGQGHQHILNTFSHPSTELAWLSLLTSSKFAQSTCNLWCLVCDTVKHRILGSAQRDILPIISCIDF